MLASMAASDQTDQLETLLSSLWPDQLRDTEDQDQLKHGTVHAVIAASILKNTKPRQQSHKSAIPRIHQNDLPKKPKCWNDLRDHPLGERFRDDAELELRNLESRSCWRVVRRVENTPTPIPLKWVFTYKTDPDGYLIRCRSRIVVRGDL